MSYLVIVANGVWFMVSLLLLTLGLLLALAPPWSTATSWRGLGWAAVGALSLWSAYVASPLPLWLS